LVWAFLIRCFDIDLWCSVQPSTDFPSCYWSV
jgi:hypothetical protein